MKHKILCLVTAIFMGLVCLGGCTENGVFSGNDLTDVQVVQEVRLYFQEQFKDNGIYKDLDLPLTHMLNGKYKVYLSWKSSDESLLNSSTGVIKRPKDHTPCSLTLTIDYQTERDVHVFDLRILANKYVNENLFAADLSDFVGICFDLYTLYYNDDGTLHVEIYMLNKSSSKKRIKGISYARFNIYKRGNPYSTYVLKKYVFTQENGAFTCKYGSKVKISFNVAAKDIYVKAELSQGDYILDSPDNQTRVYEGLI